MLREFILRWLNRKGNIIITINVNTSQLDAARQKVTEFNQMLDEVNKKMEGIDKRVDSHTDNLEDAGID